MWFVNVLRFDPPAILCCISTIAIVKSVGASSQLGIIVGLPIDSHGKETAKSPVHHLAKHVRTSEDILYYHLGLYMTEELNQNTFFSIRNQFTSYHLQDSIRFKKLLELHETLENYLFCIYKKIIFGPVLKLS